MKNFISFNDLVKLYKETPPEKMLWSGVKSNSIGFIYGPAKSGKTVFCENLAIAFATGQGEFFGYPLEGIPKKVLFVGLEEFWRNRVERNLKQSDNLTEEKKSLVGTNYLFQPIDFSRTIIGTKELESLHQMVAKSGAEVVFIDSITRMNPGKLEDSKDSGKLMLRLRTMSQDLGITLFAIHHTPKMGGRPITIDSIKGSSTFSQEADFAIGINRTQMNYRYMKNVFFRYASDNDDFVKEFQISNSATADFIGNTDETNILLRSDGRRANDKRELIVNYFNSNPTTTFPIQHMLEWMGREIDVKQRQAKDYLSELYANGRINKARKGWYCSVNYVANEKAAEDE